MARRTGSDILMLTHLIPPLGATKQGPYPIPDGPLSEADYTAAVTDGGFEGTTVVGTDLVSVRLPAE